MSGSCLFLKLHVKINPTQFCNNVTTNLGHFLSLGFFFIISQNSNKYDPFTLLCRKTVNAPEVTKGI